MNGRGDGEGRRVLLLQGPSSFFFSALGDALAARGAEVHRIHLCPGDLLFWRRGGGRLYRGRAADWPAHVRGFMAEADITDLVLLGDNRPAHREAIDAARGLGVRVHHAELGYFRPDWLTLEPDGGGANSRFPRDPEAIRALAAAHPEAPEPDGTKLYRSSFAAYAAMDVAWNLSNLALGWALTPGYRRHQTWHPLAEYGGFLAKMARGGARRRRAERIAAGWIATEGPLFLLPLQLRTDFQIRAHGPDADLRVTVRRVAASFAAHAPADARLLVKEHPMDNGLTPWRRIVAEAAGDAAARVETIDGGDLDALIARSAGVVTVNSTVGLSALAAGRPVKTLGAAIFDVPGMTDPQPLESFWNAPAPPDPELTRDFVRALTWATQLRGGFDGEGVGPGAEAMADRILEAPRV